MTWVLKYGNRITPADKCIKEAFDNLKKRFEIQVIYEEDFQLHFDYLI